MSDEYQIVSYCIGATIEIRCYKFATKLSLQTSHYKIAGHYDLTTTRSLWIHCNMATTNSLRQCSIVSHGIGVTIEIRCYKLDMTCHYNLPITNLLQSAHYRLTTSGHYNLAITRSLRIATTWSLQPGHYKLATTWPLQTCHNLATTILPQPSHYKLTTMSSL